MICHTIARSSKGPTKGASGLLPTIYSWLQGVSPSCALDASEVKCDWTLWSRWSKLKVQHQNQESGDPSEHKRKRIGSLRCRFEQQRLLGAYFASIRVFLKAGVWCHCFCGSFSPATFVGQTSVVQSKLWGTSAICPLICVAVRVFGEARFVTHVYQCCVFWLKLALEP